jgi:transmembrane 9 superfamily protein 2/4
VAVGQCRAAYYLPGVSPRTYEQYESVKLFVTKLTSTKTQIPYDYYSLPYCKPKKLSLAKENLGEVFSGDRIENSVYKLEIKVPEACEVACVQYMSSDAKKKFANAIDDEYRVHWIVDSLPVGTYTTNELGETIFNRGFPVGFKSGTSRRYKRYLNNHLRIILQYHDDFDDNFGITGASPITGVSPTTKIVGFRVEAMSIKHSWGGSGSFVPGQTVLSTCNAMTPPTNDPRNFQGLELGRNEPIVFTYDVFWEKSETEWTNRWDIYFTAKASNDKVHWFSITNSIVIVLFLTVMIAMILVRALRKDIAQYNDAASLEEAQEESGWKLVHGDVFRPPATQPMLFSVLIGSGVQLICMFVATLSFALVGLLSPSNRGSLVTGFILLFVFMGSFAGYYSSMTYKMFRGTEWKNNTIMTAFLFPGLVFTVFFFINLTLWAEGSSGAVPFSSFVTLIFLWFCVSVPLVFLGSFFGYKREAMTFPVRTNQIPRAIPVQAWYMSPAITCMLGGILPFGAVSVELYFIMSALWLHQIYYIFGFLFLVMVVLVVTCAEISILLCYFQLCNEDYRWWWRSFLTSGSSAAYLLLYAVWYNLTELDMDSFVPLMLYCGYMSMMAVTAFIITGTIGYLACLWFNCKIYASIKVD